MDKTWPEECSQAFHASDASPRPHGLTRVLFEIGRRSLEVGRSDHSGDVIALAKSFSNPRRGQVEDLNQRLPVQQRRRILRPSPSTPDRGRSHRRYGLDKDAGAKRSSSTRSPATTSPDRGVHERPPHERLTHELHPLHRHPEPTTPEPIAHDRLCSARFSHSTGATDGPTNYLEGSDAP